MTRDGSGPVTVRVESHRTTVGQITTGGRFAWGSKTYEVVGPGDNGRVRVRDVADESDVSQWHPEVHVSLV